jgi:hypothetical protein
MDFFKKLFKTPIVKSIEEDFSNISPPTPLQPEHVHQWEVLIKTYAPPRPNVEDLPPDVFQKALFGITTLLSKCVLCSESKQEEILGTDEQPLDQLIEKVNQFGPQYIQKEGVTFIVAKYQPPTQQSTNLPLR